MALPKRHVPQHDGDRQAGAPGTEPDWHPLYEIENPAEVDAYVAEHPTVASVLGEAPGQISTIFGSDAQSRLRLAYDPEAGDCWLTIKIPVDDVGPSALPLLDALDERWWLDRMLTTNATVVFDVTER